MINTIEHRNEQLSKNKRIMLVQRTNAFTKTAQFIIKLRCLIHRVDSLLWHSDVINDHLDTAGNFERNYLILMKKYNEHKENHKYDN